MCNLYNLRVTKLELVDYFESNESFRRELEQEKDYVAPGKPGLVVREQDGQRVVDQMKWGFPTRKPRKRPAKAGELPWLYDWWTNARNLTNNMWKGALQYPEQRCLVPFTRFAEPKAVANRTAPGDQLVVYRRRPSHPLLRRRVENRYGPRPGVFVPDHRT